MLGVTAVMVARGAWRASRPPSKRARKAADFREAEQICNLRDNEGGILQVLLRQLPACFVDKAAKRRAFFFQLTLHTAQADLERARDGVLIAFPGRQPLDQSRLHASCELARFQTSQIVGRNLLVDALED